MSLIWKPTRRDILGTLAWGAVSISTTGLFAETLATTAGVTEGPFYPDKLPLDTDNDLLVINGGNERIAANICGNPEGYDTANREENPYSGKVSYVASPYLDSTAWHLIASNEEAKPLILAMREQPHLQSAWFDPKAPNGGRHYFKFYARYEVHYGDWRLAYQGNT